MCSCQTISQLEPILFKVKQQDAPSICSGFKIPAKRYLKMPLLMKKSIGIARYVHRPFKNSVHTFFEVFNWRLPQICNILARTVHVIEAASKRFQQNLYKFRNC